MVSARDLLVQQGFASARPGNMETWHAVDRVDGQAEAIGLVADCQFKRRVDVAFLLVRT